MTQLARNWVEVTSRNAIGKNGMAHENKNRTEVHGQFPSFPALVLTLAICMGSVYANLALFVTDPADYRFFPPFQRGYNANINRMLGGETYEIAKALLAGEGFAHPFKERTGPTAWTAPVHPTFVALLLWACDGDADAVAVAIIALKTVVLIGTGWFILLLALKTTSHVGPWLVAAVYVLLLFSSFRAWFQTLGGAWRYLLAVDLVLAGCCSWRPFDQRGEGREASGEKKGTSSIGTRHSPPVAMCRLILWGALGGLCALLSPIIGFTWAVLSVLAAGRRGAWSRLAVALLAFGLTISPWVVRNYLVFGRLIPVKSNAAYELYQSQCMQPDGLLQRATLASHPLMQPGTERAAYKSLGEPAFLDLKRRQFLRSVAADPLGFLKRVVDRFLGAVVWYVPWDRAEDTDGPVLLWLQRLIHVLPFLAILVLVYGPGRQPLYGAQWVALGIYVFHLLPYIVISYYESYGLPLLSVKALLVIWGADRLLSWRAGVRRQIQARATAQPLSFSCANRLQKWRVLSGLALLGLALVSGLLYVLHRPPRQPLVNVVVGYEFRTDVGESGFYAARYDQQGQPYRWTNGAARLTIPIDPQDPPRAVRLKLLPWRPARAELAQVRISVNRRELFNERVPRDFWERTLDLGSIDLGSDVELDIGGSTFIPKHFDPLADSRPYGVEVRAVELLGRIPDAQGETR